MIIIFKIDKNTESFLSEIFPEYTRLDMETLKKELKEFYTIDDIAPEIEIAKDYIKIEINFQESNSEKSKFNKAIAFCESRKYNDAKPILKGLIQNNPTNSEYHRILGQVLSDEGDQEEAINYLIDALKWNPKNPWALTMMGNIFTRYRKDSDTALVYYNQSLTGGTEDNIALNNIGANLFQSDQSEKAMTYFEKALELDSEYPNTHLGIALIHNATKDFKQSFLHALKALKYNNQKDEIFNNAFRLAIESAQKIIEGKDALDIVKGYGAKLEIDGGKEIEFEESQNISTSAKIEFAENYERDYHIVKYKNTSIGYEHLILHELIHLDLVIQARAIDKNELFITNDTQKILFGKKLESWSKKMHKSGFDKESIGKVTVSLFEGINRQVYNTPIDLFIEDIIYNKFEDLKAHQFLSLLQMVKEGINAVTDKAIIKRMSPWVLSKSRIYNIINTIHFNKLFNIDLTGDLKATKVEINLANECYTEFLEYREDKQAAEEYELVQHWAEDLELSEYFELVYENDFHSKLSIDDILEDGGMDKLMDKPDASEDKKMKTFIKEHTSEDVNMAVVMYMISAIEYYKKFSKEELKNIAFEIAQVGMSGIDPEKKKGYKVPSISEIDFSGYQLLSYYYTSWALALPEMLSELQMPFDKEYELAIKFKK